MKSLSRTTALGLALLAYPLSVSAQTPGEIPFDSVPNFLKMPPGLYLGENAGVAVNSKGHIFVYTRSGAPGHIVAPQAAQLFEFAPDGSFVREIGKNLYSMAWAHAVRIDKDDNIWLVDNGSDMIVKLSPAGHVMLVLGRRRESVASTHTHPALMPGTPTPPARDTAFNEPTDVTWDPAGNIFISDGYKNMSVAKFDKNGKWIKRVGKGNGAEAGSGPGEFSNPHGIAADAAGNVYVADRSNGRVQVLDSDLKFVRNIVIDIPPPPDATLTGGYDKTLAPFKPGAPWAVCITPGPNQVLFVADAYPGRVYKLGLDGTVLGYFGTDGKELKQFNWIHAIACPSENEVLVAELLTWRVQKLLLKPSR
ncbi:MAG: 6-bladed beta-propeller [Vicinamibacteria bacterium]|nr:6-bladed beta-propeller [Vicinamibacteria bacterium]